MVLLLTDIFTDGTVVIYFTLCTSSRLELRLLFFSSFSAEKNLLEENE